MRAPDPAAETAAFVAAGRVPVDITAADRQAEVKICGIVDEDGMRAASRAGADYAGLNVVAGTPRALSTEQAARRVLHRRRCDHSPRHASGLPRQLPHPCPCRRGRPSQARRGTLFSAPGSSLPDSWTMSGSTASTNSAISASLLGSPDEASRSSHQTSQPLARRPCTYCRNAEKWPPPAGTGARRRRTGRPWRSRARAFPSPAASPSSAKPISRRPSSCTRARIAGSHSVRSSASRSIR